jgi:hypothetical protein
MQEKKLCRCGDLPSRCGDLLSRRCDLLFRRGELLSAEVRAAVLNIARKELIQIGKYAIASTSRGELLLKLPNVQSINDMYDSKIATNRS